MNGEIKVQLWQRVVGHIAGSVPWMLLVGSILLLGWHGLWVEPAFWQFVGLAATLMVTTQLLVSWIIKHDRVIWRRRTPKINDSE